MPSKKKLPRKPERRRPVRRAKKGSAAQSGDSGLSHRLHDLRDQIDMILPEVTARVAALEHLLIEKQLCTREDLVRAREFVRTLEA